MVPAPDGRSLLLSLPQELLIEILIHLPLSALAACRLTSRALDTLIVNDVLLQYSIELRAAGVIDNPSSPFPIHERLRLLKERERAWSRVEVADSCTVDVLYRPSTIYDLTGGVFLLGESLSNTGLHGRRGTDALRFVHLPSLLSQAHTRGDDSDSGEDAWARIIPEAATIDIGLSVQEHDLVAVVTKTYLQRDALDRTISIDVHLLQLSTGKKHPAVSQPVLHVCDILHGGSHFSVSVEISGDRMGVLFNSSRILLGFFEQNDPTVFHVYNWKTGALLLTRTPENSAYSSFCFLAPDVIVLPDVAEGTLELCYLDAAPHDGQPRELQAACALALPRLSASCTMLKIWCRSEPNPMGATSAGPLHTAQPFSADPAQAIVLFSVLVLSPEAEFRTLTLIVHRSSLLARMPPAPSVSQSACDPCEQGQAAPPVLVPVPWTEWGPSVSRWFDMDDIATRWITVTCGQRLVRMADTAPAPIEVLDFNPLAVRRAPPDGEVHKEAELMASSAFHDPVVSALPYVVSRTREEYDCDSVLVDEDVIVGMKMDQGMDHIRQICLYRIGLSRMTG
ncbi:hypothetical protein WOLCODRAFT_145295 [Wolfiporia cocos MD-104 SS10]|uniref:F-box domain-containing protein n=1 Tax=Wolfiporia cocos (strain MD-104) TaxID=742152 RepID=A0A2H3JSA8_WOLCO|nr:hypothetical protein WOLCODRAFT_145295 [Wolfiporia cocos MD-104 SS10]